MNINFESDIIDESDDGFFLAGTEVSVHEILSELATGITMSDFCELYEIEESKVAQLLQDISECFR